MSKPKRQKVLPAALRDDLVDVPQQTKASRATPSKNGASSGLVVEKEITEEQLNPKQLYGLYSTEQSDYCSGCWFPITYVGPATEDSSTTSTDATVPASAASSSSTAAPAQPKSILIRWSTPSTASLNSSYDSEPLACDFIRTASEFVPLTIDAMKAGKRVLVRDILVDKDFKGITYWLATLKSEPTKAPTTASKSKSKKTKRATREVDVEYQNHMWPATAVSVEAIYVLPKQKQPLDLEAAAALAAKAAAEAAAAAASNTDATVAASASSNGTSQPVAAASSSSSNGHVDTDMAPVSSPEAQPFAYSSPQLASDVSPADLLPPLDSAGTDSDEE